MSRASVCLVLAASVMFAAAAVLPHSKASAASPSTALVDLRSVADLRVAFNHDRGQIRIILLVSPT
jgi:hypothetical protein